MRLVTATVAVFGITAGIAYGGMVGETQTIESTILMEESFPAFHGTVVSDNAACEGDRTVKLFRKTSGGGKELLGKTTTKSSGKWKVILDPLSSGAYFSKLKKLTEGTAGTIYVCTSDKSQVAIVD